MGHNVSLVTSGVNVEPRHIDVQSLLRETLPRRADERMCVNNSLHIMHSEKNLCDIAGSLQRTFLSPANLSSLIRLTSRMLTVLMYLRQLH